MPRHTLFSIQNSLSLAHPIGSDSTIEQTIRLRTNELKPSAADDDMEKIFEERQRRAILEIERPSAERCEYGGGKPPKPN
jgi:hypothetical protein